MDQKSWETIGEGTDFRSYVHFPSQVKRLKSLVHHFFQSVVVQFPLEQVFQKGYELTEFLHYKLQVLFFVSRQIIFPHAGLRQFQRPDRNTIQIATKGLKPFVTRVTGSP